MPGSSDLHGWLLACTGIAVGRAGVVLDKRMGTRLEEHARAHVGRALCWMGARARLHVVAISILTLPHDRFYMQIFHVAERALFFWNNDQIVNLIAHNRDVILPVLFPALEKNAQSHWNHSVLNLTLNVRKMLMEMDEVLFLACQAHFREEEAQITFAVEKRKQAWECLENAACLQPITGNTAVLISKGKRELLFKFRFSMDGLLAAFVDDIQKIPEPFSYTVPLQLSEALSLSLVCETKWSCGRGC
ncbi:hypothetical protein RJ639_041163 [Escallonia herrerae]|uniref:Uncharacterized protein n=1 Tax=Escallonia herrerae TaxID=1293975 RepID=A0AA88WKQ4_9ASTE|nr:hypothetical protein RJ639_041163 [Escallonia herrerae]